MSYVILRIIQIGVFVSLFTLLKCEVFTAATDVEKLLNTHENVLNNLEQYIAGEESRLKILKR